MFLRGTKKGDVPTSTTSPTFLQAARAKSGPLSMLISAHVASRLHQKNDIEISQYLDLPSA